MKKVLLYSGGMDSWLIDKLWQPDVKLFFDIGTENNKQELERAKKRDDVVIVKLPLGIFEQADNGYYLPLRNLHFALYAAHYGDIICLGATGSSTHKDKNEVFANLSANAINYLLSEDPTRDAPVEIVMPFRGVSKTDMLAQYIEQGGDIDKCYKETFSCYAPNEDGTPCGKCISCLSKFTAFYNNGYAPLHDEKAEKEFVKNAFSNPRAKDDVIKLAQRLRHKKTACIDFDNTLTEESPYPITGKIKEEWQATLTRWHDNDCRIVLYTSRVGADFNEAVRMCKQANLPIDEYVKGKPQADCYIDDKAVITAAEAEERLKA